jgi:hypothetical protein
MKTNAASWSHNYMPGPSRVKYPNA